MSAENRANDTDDSAENDNQQQQTATPQQPDYGPGHLLKRAREAKNLSQRDVADRLRLRLQIIELLEADEYDTFSTPTFIKGYLRSYAKLLGVDDADIFAAYRKMGVEEPTTTTMQSFSRRVKHQESDNRLMLITYAVIIVVIGLVIWWWQDSDLSFTELSTDVQQAVNEQPASSTQSPQLQAQPETRESAQNDTDLAAPERVLESTVRENNPAATETTEAELDNNNLTESDAASAVTVTDTEQADTALAEVNQANTETATETEADSDTQPAPPTVTDTDSDADGSELAEVNTPVAETEPSSAAALVFEFSEECWVKVDDATGETQAVGVKAAGYNMPVPGTAPFAITICKPSAVTISYQGETVDLSGFRQNRVARFSIPLANDSQTN